jgi:Uncharacterized protein conserved in bacteria
MTDLLMDTVAFVRYLEDDLPLPAAAAVEKVERENESILLPQIALSEFVYIALKGRLNLTNPLSVIGQVIDQLKSSPIISISSMPIDAWDVFVQLKVPELHDRMIAAEALYRNIPLISNDPAFDVAKDLKIIWK